MTLDELRARVAASRKLTAGKEKDKVEENIVKAATPEAEDGEIVINPPDELSAVMANNPLLFLDVKRLILLLIDAGFTFENLGEVGIAPELILACAPEALNQPMEIVKEDEPDETSPIIEDIPDSGSSRQSVVYEDAINGGPLAVPSICSTENLAGAVVGGTIDEVDEASDAVQRENPSWPQEFADILQRDLMKPSEEDMAAESRLGSSNVCKENIAVRDSYGAVLVSSDEITTHLECEPNVKLNGTREDAVVVNSTAAVVSILDGDASADAIEVRSQDSDMEIDSDDSIMKIVEKDARSLKVPNMIVEKVAPSTYVVPLSLLNKPSQAGRPGRPVAAELNSWSAVKKFIPDSIKPLVIILSDDEEASTATAIARQKERSPSTTFQLAAEPPKSVKRIEEDIRRLSMMIAKKEKLKEENIASPVLSTFRMMSNSSAIGSQDVNASVASKDAAANSKSADEGKVARSAEFRPSVNGNITLMGLADSETKAKLESEIRADEDLHASAMKDVKTKEESVRVLQGNVATKESELSLARAELERMKSEFEALRLKIEETEARIDSLGREATEATSQIRALKKAVLIKGTIATQLQEGLNAKRKHLLDLSKMAFAPTNSVKRKHPPKSQMAPKRQKVAESLLPKLPAPSPSDFIQLDAFLADDPVTSRVEEAGSTESNDLKVTDDAIERKIAAIDWDEAVTLHPLFKIGSAIQKTDDICSIDSEIVVDLFSQVEAAASTKAEDLNSVKEQLKRGRAEGKSFDELAGSITKSWSSMAHTDVMPLESTRKLHIAETRISRPRRERSPQRASIPSVERVSRCDIGFRFPPILNLGVSKLVSGQDVSVVRYYEAPFETDDYEKMLRKNPKDVKLWMDYAASTLPTPLTFDVLTKPLKTVNLSLSVLSRALQMNRDSSELWNFYLEVYLRLALENDARQVLEEAVGFVPLSKQIWWRYYYFEKDSAKREDVLRRMLQAFGQDTVEIGDSA
ncbi:Zinc finger C3H1 domain-containing protein [Irineochytrium annulatum]|nr:Zinc finger C3H1 domain-containing protein [Irineochytrium annulatum]